MKEQIKFSDPIIERVFVLVKQVGSELRDYLYQLSLERITGLTHDDAAFHDIEEPRSIILTEADIKMHRAVVETFKNDPVTIIAEEGLVTKKGAVYRIVLDDLDGTYNASRGVLGRSAVSLAVDKNKKPLAGIWYNPYFDEMVISEMGDGVWYLIGDKIVKVSTIASPRALSKARIITGSTGTTNDSRSKLINPPLSKLISQILSPINFGCSAVSLMDVALGRAEGFVIAGNKAWDLWSARTILSELKIPFAFFSECWQKILTEEEVENFDPENHLFGFACAANEDLFWPIVEILTRR